MIVYFDTRPVGSRIGAWASPQSTTIEDRSELDRYVREMRDKFKVDEEGAEGSEKHIPVPSYWGGLRIVPHRVEFWSGRNNRLHDRLVMSRTQSGDRPAPADAEWTLERLAP